MSDNVPQCGTKGCYSEATSTGVKRKDGSIIYRKYQGKYICQPCHYSRLGIRGWEYKNNRKDYCENAKGQYKGWLPVPCVITEMFPKFLSVDHVDGNHHNNAPDNLMTLCPTCHAVKTWIFDAPTSKL